MEVDFFIFILKTKTIFFKHRVTKIKCSNENIKLSDFLPFFRFYFSRVQMDPFHADVMFGLISIFLSHSRALSLQMNELFLQLFVHYQNGLCVCVFVYPFQGGLL